MSFLQVENPILNRSDVYPLSFETKEELSKNPEYVLQFQSLDGDIDLDALLGDTVRVSISNEEGGIPISLGFLSSVLTDDEACCRSFYGYVTAAYDAGFNGENYVYRIEINTWLWFLMQNRNCRIFQDLNIIEIIEQIFSRYTFAEYRLEIEGNYDKREYCVQFSETDFSFINRLMEDEGVWYYFVHADGKHSMVITDKQSFE